MLKTLVEHSLRFRGIVMVLALLLVCYGLSVTRQAKLDVFPDFVPPEVVVQTEAPGFSPEQVEQLVTRPVESAINGLGELDALRSETIQGLSVVTAVFKDSADIFRARQNLAERLSEVAGELPAGVKAPRMEPMTSSTMDLLKIGVTSDTLTPMELRTFADWTLKPLILSVQGVAKCSCYGGEVRQLQIQIDPDAMDKLDISIDEIVSAAKAATGIYGAGFIDTHPQRVVLQAKTPDITPENLQMAIVTQRDGKPIRVKDVAKVTEGAEPAVGDAIINGKPGVLLTMSSQYGANTMDVTERLEEALNTVDYKAHGVVYHPGLHRPATFITSSINNIDHSLKMGGILVAVVLFLFLFNIRTALISLAAIPLSLLTAIIVMDRLGFSLNTITLGGLAIAIGEVVDDAIIDVENIFRRLRENRLLEKPRNTLKVILDASLEVRSAVVYATFVVAFIFIPVLTLPGLNGKFFAPLGWAYIIAILASLLVAILVTPAMSMILLAKGILKAHEPPLQKLLKAVYAGILKTLLKHPFIMSLCVLILCVLTPASLYFFGQELMPEFREGHFVMDVQMAPGTSMEQMRKFGVDLSKKLLEIPHVSTVEQQIGRAELGEDTWGPERSEYHLNLDDGVTAEQQAQAEEKIVEAMESFPGVKTEITTFLGDRIGESITGEKAPVVINLFGENLEDLDAAAYQIATALNSIPGHGEVAVKTPRKSPTLVIKPRDEDLQRFGFTRAQVLDSVRVAFAGEIVGEQYEGNRVADVVAILDPKSRDDLMKVKNLKTVGVGGVRKPISELADVYLDSTRTGISHEKARRRQVVSATPEGVDPGSFEALAKEKIKTLKLPLSVETPEFAGAAAEAAEARDQLLIHSGAAIIGILILLAIVFHNWRNVLLLLVNLPFALIGGVIAVAFVAWRHGDLHFEGISAFLAHPAEALKLGALSIGEMVGFVTLFGITTRNSIMMISHFEHLVKIDKMPWNAQTALKGASERLSPILMTAMVTAIGLLPLALGSGEAGREIEGPMAIVILGGLVSSTLLNLLVMPSLALRFGSFRVNEEETLIQE